MVSSSPRDDPGDQRSLNHYFCVFAVHYHCVVSHPYPRRGTTARRNPNPRRDRMSQNRRDFIKFVIAGSVAAGCPIDPDLLAAPATHGPQKLVEGEQNEI